MDYGIKIPDKDNLGSSGYSYYRGLAVMFAGLIIVDIANSLLLLTISILQIDEEVESTRIDSKAATADTAAETTTGAVSAV